MEIYFPRLSIRSVDRIFKISIEDTYLFREDSDVLVEAFWRAYVTARDARFTRRTRRQLALLENQRKKREQGVSVTQQEKATVR